MFRNRYGKAAVDNVHHMFKLRAEPRWVATVPFGFGR